jgi:hypothetical protein
LVIKKKFWCAPRAERATHRKIVINVWVKCIGNWIAYTYVSNVTVSPTQLNHSLTHDSKIHVTCVVKPITKNDSLRFNCVITAKYFHSVNYRNTCNFILFALLGSHAQIL